MARSRRRLGHITKREKDKLNAAVSEAIRQCHRHSPEPHRCSDGVIELEKQLRKAGF